MAKEKMKVVNQSQTQKINPQPNKGMEIFLNPTPNSNSQKPNDPQPNGNKVSQMQKDQPQVKPNDPKINQSMEEQPIEYKIEQLERELKIKTTLDLTTFNNIAHNKQLMFKVLFIRQKIYLHVKDNNGRNTIIAINVPRYGGTSLRYMISQCTTEYCKVVEKKTNKGNILSYSPISTSPNNDTDIEDIFD